MRRFAYLIIYSCLTLVLWASCSLESSDNGDLDGFWQMYQLDTLATGGVTDVRDSVFCWAFQMRLMEIKNPTGDPFLHIIFRFEHTKDSLVLSNPYYSDRMSGDIPVTDTTALNRFGLYHIPEAFYIESLNSDRMHLRSDRLRFHFRKY